MVSKPAYTFAQYLNVRGAGPGALSPDGGRLLFLSATTGTPQLWLLDKPRAWPQQVTFFPDRVNPGSWTPDGARILFTTDVGGNEKTQIFTVRPDGSELRRLTTRDDVIHTPGDFHPQGRHVAYAANDRNGRDFDLYLLDIETGETRRVLEAEGSNTPLAFTRDGSRLVYSRYNGSLDNDLLLLDLATGAVDRLTPHGGGALFQFAGFSADGAHLYLATNQDRDFLQRARLDLGARTLHFLADEDADTEAFSISHDGRTLAHIVNREGYGDLHITDVATGKKLAVSHLPHGIAYGISWARHAPYLSVSVLGATRPSGVWRIDLRNGAAAEWTQPALAGIDPASFVEAQRIRYPSFDGLEIPAFLYVPRGARADGTLPVVMDIHGGPESQERPDFNPVIQYLVQRGYAVLAPNIRGSTGYGKAYTHRDDREKRLDAIRDIAAGADWLRASGWAGAGKTAIMGGSYGGYATLASLTFHPDKWAAGVDIVGISNLLTFLRNTGAYRRKLRAAEYGDPERDAEFLRSVSPFHFVDRIRAPISADRLHDLVRLALRDARVVGALDHQERGADPVHEVER
jgi:dipeptidyl aminopeptidase/acylaminoacyl peptidase